MTINGKELKFKLTNAATAERYEAALHRMEVETQKAQQNPPQSLAEAIRAQTGIVQHFVDGIFGEGTYATLGIDPDELDDNLEVAGQIIADAGEQSKAIQRRNARYSPERGKRSPIKLA